MKFELKNVKFYEKMSEETNAFTADLFIDGKNIASVRDDGRGGCIDYQVHDFKNQQILRDAEAYCKALPKVHIEKYNFDMQPTLETTIGDLFEAWLDVKEEKKFQANMKKGLCVGVDKTHYSIITWKGTTLEAVLNAKNPAYIGNLKVTIAKYKAEGKNILNTNIPEEYLTKF